MPRHTWFRLILRFTSYLCTFLLICLYIRQTISLPTLNHRHSKLSNVNRTETIINITYIRYRTKLKYTSITNRFTKVENNIKIKKKKKERNRYRCSQIELLRYQRCRKTVLLGRAFVMRRLNSITHTCPD